VVKVPLSARYLFCPVALIAGAGTPPAEPAAVGVHPVKVGTMPDANVDVRFVVGIAYPSDQKYLYRSGPDLGREALYRAPQYCQQLVFVEGMEIGELPSVS